MEKFQNQTILLKRLNSLIRDYQELVLNSPESVCDFRTHSEILFHLSGLLREVTKLNLGTSSGWSHRNLDSLRILSDLGSYNINLKGDSINALDHQLRTIGPIFPKKV